MFDDDTTGGGGGDGMANYMQGAGGKGGQVRATNA